MRPSLIYRTIQGLRLLWDTRRLWNRIRRGGITAGVQGLASLTWWAWFWNLVSRVGLTAYMSCYMAAVLFGFYCGGLYAVSFFYSWWSGIATDPVSWISLTVSWGSWLVREIAIQTAIQESDVAILLWEDVWQWWDAGVAPLQLTTWAGLKASLGNLFSPWDPIRVTEHAIIQSVYLWCSQVLMGSLILPIKYVFWDGIYHQDWSQLGDSWVLAAWRELTDMAVVQTIISKVVHFSQIYLLNLVANILPFELGQDLVPIGDDPILDFTPEEANWLRAMLLRLLRALVMLIFGF